MSKSILKLKRTSDPSSRTQKKHQIRFYDPAEILLTINYKITLNSDSRLNFQDNFNMSHKIQPIKTA